MVLRRNRSIVIKSQFNINGSRGKNVRKFISDYVSRPEATRQMSGYRPDPNRVPVLGDGVAFTMDQAGVARQTVLDTADHVQTLFEEGNRAVQQMVVSFDPKYLTEQRIVPEGIQVLKKGDYRRKYDDIALQDAVRARMQTLIDNEGYQDAKAIMCIQEDTRHLHVHAVMWEDRPKVVRQKVTARGLEEKGVIKESSLTKATLSMDQKLTLRKRPKQVITADELKPKPLAAKEPFKVQQPAAVPSFVDRYLEIYQLQEKQLKEKKNQRRLALQKKTRQALARQKQQSQNRQKQAEINRLIDQVDLDDLQVQVDHQKGK